MLRKKSKPVIGMLTGSLLSSNRSEIVDTMKIYSESKTQSPKGVKGFDSGGVGLGIVVALEKKGDDPSEILANKALFTRSNPIPVTLPKNFSGIGGDLEEMEMENSEEYTIVTCHGPNKSYTKVYFDGVEHGRKSDDEDKRTPFRIQSSIKNDRTSVFHIFPSEVAGIPAHDFLSSCNLCQKQLHGKDIYMYRERAFCSTECRCRQIAMDELKEKCRLKASRAVDISSSNGQFFTSRILAI